MLNVCLGCGTRYAESLGTCPQCRGTQRRADHENAPAEAGTEDGDGEDEEEASVPKITTWGGASHPEDTAGNAGSAADVSLPAAGVPGPGTSTAAAAEGPAAAPAPAPAAKRAAPALTPRQPAGG